MMRTEFKSGRFLRWEIAGLLSAAGCIHQGERGTPLYDSSAPLERDRVAMLSGHVQYVDGKDVSSLASPYELLPGCHVVGTPATWGASSFNGAVTAQTGTIWFAIPMQAGRRYSVRVDVPHMTGPTGTLTIAAHEQDAEGNGVGMFGPASSEEDLAGCGEARPPARR